MGNVKIDNNGVSIKVLACKYQLFKKKWMFVFSYLYFLMIFLPDEASCGARAQSVSVRTSGCGFDPHSRKLNIDLNLYFYFFVLVSRRSAALSSATWHAMLPEFDGKWGGVLTLGSSTSVSGIQSEADLIYFLPNALLNILRFSKNYTLIKYCLLGGRFQRFYILRE